MAYQVDGITFESVPRLGVHGITPEVATVTDTGRLLGLIYDIRHLIDVSDEMPKRLQKYKPVAARAAFGSLETEAFPNREYFIGRLGGGAVRHEMPDFVGLYEEVCTPMMQAAIKYEGKHETVHAFGTIDNIAEGVVTYPRGLARSYVKHRQDIHIDIRPSGICPVLLPDQAKDETGGELIVARDSHLSVYPNDRPVRLSHRLGHMLFFVGGTSLAHYGDSVTAYRSDPNVPVRAVFNLMWGYEGQTDDSPQLAALNDSNLGIVTEGS